MSEPARAETPLEQALALARLAGAIARPPVETLDLADVREALTCLSAALQLTIAELADRDQRAPGRPYDTPVSPN
jgi:hypothetical protein